MSEYEPSPIIPIGNKKFLSIEYPGYVKKVKRAIETLGGEKALSEALAKEASIVLKFRPKDIFSHPINGEMTDTAKLLVKVTRRIKKLKATGQVVEDDSEAPWKTEILGIILKTVRFRALADFQYLVPKDNKIRVLKEALLAGNVDQIINYNVPTDDNNLENLEAIPPPSFTQVDFPLVYGYRQNSGLVRVKVKQPDGTYKIKLVNRQKASKIMITLIKFEEENVPTKSWHILPSIEGGEDQEAFDMITKLFEERPIWTKYAILNLVPAKLHSHLRKALVHHGYMFLNGAWRESWIKYGIDPRTDVKYSIYELIDIRRINTSVGPRAFISTRAVTRVTASDISKQTRVDTPTSHIFDGKSMPGNTCHYLLSDVSDPDIYPIIHNPAYLKDRATKTSGFYYTCVYHCIRKAVKKKYYEIIEKGKAEPIKNLERDLAEQIAKEIGNENQADEEEEEEEFNQLNEITTTVAATDKIKIEQAAKIAFDESKKAGGIAKRLKQVVDEYMDELESTKSSTNYFEGGDESYPAGAVEELDEYIISDDELLENEEEEEEEEETVKNKRAGFQVKQEEATDISVADVEMKNRKL